MCVSSGVGLQPHKIVYEIDQIYFSVLLTPCPLSHPLCVLARRCCGYVIRLYLFQFVFILLLHLLPLLISLLAFGKRNKIYSLLCSKVR